MLWIHAFWAESTDLSDSGWPFAQAAFGGISLERLTLTSAALPHLNDWLSEES